MALNFKEFEDRIISALKDSKLIEKFSISEFEQTPELSVIIKYFEKPSLIDFDENGLFFFDENNDKCYCPEMRTSISDKGEWISNKLPPISFDIDQSGNIRKADEAEALYICTQVAHIIKESSFRTELEEVSKDYDFNKMCGRVNKDKSFRSLLKEWQGLQSVIINIIVSASKYKISSTKKDTEKFLKDGIQDSMAAELRNLESKIRSINFKYSQGVLSPDRVKNLTKIERLQEIDKRDDEISESIVNSSVGDLYRALNLSSEYISPVKKKKLALWIQSEVDKLISESQFSDLKEDRKSLISKFTRRAYRFEKSSIRKLAVESFIKDPENFKLPSKL